MISTDTHTRVSIKSSGMHRSKENIELVLQEACIQHKTPETMKVVVDIEERTQRLESAQTDRVADKERMRVQIARIWEDSDYDKVRSLCEGNSGWTQVYKKDVTSVWVQPAVEGDFHVIKAHSTFSDVSSDIVYDVLHDAEYRKKWDKHMCASKDIGILNPNNDVCYYALSSLPPIRPRDFVMQRSWLDTGKEKLICSHSVCHDDFPPQKGYIRGTVFMAGYRIQSRSSGCDLTYVTHSDPKGKLPVWLVNRVTKVIAPKVIKKLHKACIAYPSWKQQHNSHWKPWLFPEQMLSARRVSVSECRPREYNQEIVDESALDAKSCRDAEDDD